MLAYTLFAIGFLWLGFSYVGYPVLLTVLARVFHNPWARGTHRPSVIVYLAAFNEGSNIAEKIRSILAQSYSGEMAIVVADDGSTDDTKAAAEQALGNAGWVVSSQENIGKTAMQNLVVPTLTSEVVIFTDATGTWPPGLVEKLVTHFADQDVGCVGPDVSIASPNPDSVGANQSLYWKMESMLRQAGAKIWTNVVVSGTCYAIRRALFRPLPAEIAEDLGTPLQIALSGKRVVFDPEIVVVDVGTDSTAQESRMRRRIALQNLTAVFWSWRRLRNANPFAVFQFLSHKFLRSFNWLAMILLLVGNLLLLQTSVIFAGILVAQLTAYLLAALGIVLNRSDLKLFSVPRYFMLLNFSYALAMFDFCVGRRMARWNTER